MIFYFVSKFFFIVFYMLVLFIVFMYDKKYVLFIVSLYVFVLGYFYKFLGFVDFIKVFFIIQILKGQGKIGLCFDSCLFIIFLVFNRIIELLVQFIIIYY